TVDHIDGVKNCLDIVDLVQDDKFFILYARALQTIQARDQHAWDSYFQIAGIHGIPYTEYVKEQLSLNLCQAGYCTHGQTLFPVWHRPYVLLCEVFAIEAAKKSIVDIEAWAQAAQDLHLPFWDWEVIKNEQIRIVDYDGKKISVSNPLRLVADQVREKTYDMLVYNDKWELFSNHAESDDDLRYTPRTFYTSKDRAWTSANVADTSQFGYSCPEFNKLVGGSKEHIRDATDDFVDKHYGSRRLPGLAQAVTNSGFTSQVYELEMLDWLIHVTFRKFELNDSFTILFYFGFVHLDQYIARDKGSFNSNAVKEYLKGKKLSHKFFTDDEKPLMKVRVEGRTVTLALRPGQTRARIDKSHSIVTLDDVITCVSA
ncbi:Polyphenol oxidase 2, partial [Leucoagaricus sp. SymC.cos]